MPLTVPTSLHPVGAFGFTCTTDLLPTLGLGGPWANAVPEKQIAAKTRSTLSINAPHVLRGSLIQVHIEGGAKAWTSDFEAIDSIGINLQED